MFDSINRVARMMGASRSRHGARRPPPERGKPLHACELLEKRTLLSNIVWTNRGSATNDSDQFNAVFGANANQARLVADAAFAAWGRVISNLNLSNGSNELDVALTEYPDPGSGGNGGNGRRVQQFFGPEDPRATAEPRGRGRRRPVEHDRQGPQSA